MIDRVDLISMNIKELKALAKRYGVNISLCFEKTEIISVINTRETRKKIENESLARFALRISFLDRLRNCMQYDELISFDWNIRVKSDGPLATLIPQDPWWSLDQSTPPGPTTTIVNFNINGSFSFIFSGMSPFEGMMQGSVDPSHMTYSLDGSGTFVFLNFGVREYVARHPVNWGFVLQSQGSVWTSFQMPPRGRDAFMEDEVVSSLVSNGRNYGFQI